MKDKDHTSWVKANADAVRQEMQQRGRPLTRRELDAYRPPKRTSPLKPSKG